MRFCLLAAATSLCWAALAQEAALDAPYPTVAVILNFDEHHCPSSLAAMQREVEAIMGSCSLRFQWRLLDESVSRESFEKIVVAHFKGACRNDGPPSRSATSPLGQTHLTDGQILPFLEIDCDRVRAFVQPSLARNSPFRIDQLLGRALGRVLAHELYHVLARTRLHSRSGVAKPSLQPHDLVGGRLRLEPADTEAIRRQLAPPAGAPDRVLLTHSAIHD